jgi:hypothetical protein
MDGILPLMSGSDGDLWLCFVVNEVTECVKVKVKLSLYFNWAPHHESVLGSGGIAPLILWHWH